MHTSYSARSDLQISQKRAVPHGEPLPGAGPARGPRRPRRVRIPAAAPCLLLREITEELIPLAGDIGAGTHKAGIARRARHIAMYVCNVALRISHYDIARQYGVDRSTVGYACHVVEDGRDDRAFDDFVTRLERIAVLAFGDPPGGPSTTPAFSTHPAAKPTAKPAAAPTAHPARKPAVQAVPRPSAKPSAAPVDVSTGRPAR
jgi:hypothetical protein